MKQPINEENAKKLAIIILIVSAILNFIGILCIIGFATKKIEIVKAEEEQEIYYQFQAPLTISKNLLDLITTNNQELYISANTNENGIFYNNEDFTTKYTVNRIQGIIGYTDKEISINIIFKPINAATYQTAINQYYIYNYNQTTDNYEFDHEYNSTTNQNSEITQQNLLSVYWKKGEYLDTYLTSQNKTTLFNQYIQAGIIKEITNTIQLTTPTITKNGYVIEWQTVEHAEYYNIFRNGNLHGQTQLTQWVCSENGTYTIQACTTEEGYSNSEISNSVSITEYNDIIGNGWNFYTLIGAVLDSEIILFKSLLNYEIWGINLFQAVQIILTGCLVLLIIKKFVL